MKEKFRKTRLAGTIKITLDEGKVWTAKKTDIISEIIKVCENYQNDGYTLTLRQLYYQLVSKDLIPNHMKVYKKLSNLKDAAVYGGMIDWSIFEDRGRVPYLPYFEHSVDDALKYTARTYRLNRQLNQKTDVEVWTEKDAISGILKRVTIPYGIRLVVNKGYTSSTAIHNAYKRFMDACSLGKKVTILYFGDHDPSGLDMIRDIKDRLTFMFMNGELRNDPSIEDLADKWSKTDEGEWTEEAEEYIWDEEDRYKTFGDDGVYFDYVGAYLVSRFEIVPIGLTMTQIREYQPPPNPAKLTDPRAKWYIKEYGKKSWEVDALKPAIMEEIVTQAIQETIDMEEYEKVLEMEQNDIERINKIVENL